MCRLVDQRHGEGKGCNIVLAGNRYVFAMAVDDGFDDVKAKTPAVPIQGAGFIDFVESVKDQG